MSLLYDWEEDIRVNISVRCSKRASFSSVAWPSVQATFLFVIESALQSYKYFQSVWTRSVPAFSDFFSIFLPYLTLRRITKALLGRLLHSYTKQASPSKLNVATSKNFLNIPATEIQLRISISTNFYILERNAIADGVATVATNLLESISRQVFISIFLSLRSHYAQGNFCCCWKRERESRNEGRASWDCLLEWSQALLPFSQLYWLLGFSLSSTVVSERVLSFSQGLLS